MLTLFGQQLGDRHDEVVRRTKDYLLNQSLEILKTGVSVILDWGFPTRREREETIAFFARRGFSCQGHYITASDEVLFENLRRRNLAVLAGTENAYYIDEAILQKFKDVFEEPDDTENMLRHEHFPRVSNAEKRTARHALQSFVFPIFSPRRSSFQEGIPAWLRRSDAAARQARPAPAQAPFPCGQFRR